MKQSRIFPSALAALATLALAPVAFAQTSVTTTTTGAAVAPTTVVTTTTSAGTVGTVTPDMLVMQAASGSQPVPYSRTSRTVFVDETGAVVPEEMLRAGVPVTVHYSRDLDRMVAERVIVHRKVAAPGAAVIERTTTVAPTPAVPVEREVIVEERAPVRQPAIIEKKTTTTTTTGPAVPAPAPVVVKEDEDDDD